MSNVPHRWASTFHRYQFCHSMIFFLISLMLGSLLTSCTATLPTTHAPLQSQSPVVVHETTDNTSEGETVEISARLGVLVDSSMKVVSVMSQSPAERGGVQVGDILQSFDELFLPKRVKKLSTSLTEKCAPKKMFIAYSFCEQTKSYSLRLT